MIPGFPEARIDPPEERGEADHCEGCGLRFSVEELTKDGLCYPCHEAILEDEAMREEDEAREDAYWRHINSKIDERLGK